ncbi:MAG: UDP-2,4-diacetamido-2,4,6-trideoxy-beta-L-altropyranose hydrolase [Bdellovibrionales bacterium]
MHKQQFYFRCDSSHQIGGGHLIRCLALADQLKKMGYKSEFICKDLPGSIHERAQSQGYKVHLLAPTLSQRDDSDFCLTLITKDINPIVVVDNYSLDEEWEYPLYLKTFVMVIDDSANRRHCCHMLVDYNFHLDPEKKYNELIPATATRYFGPSHIIFREEFQKIVEPAGLDRSGLIVFFGMTDATGESLKFIKSLKRMQSEYPCQLLISKSNRFYSEIKNEIVPNNLQLIEDSTELSGLFLQAKFYLGSGGIITWERLRCGLPGGVVTVANNQIEGTKNLADKNYQIYFGHFDKVNYDEVLKKCLNFLNAKDYDQLSLEQKKLKIAPFEPKLILENLEETRLRKATREDAQFLYDLRKDPTTNANSITKDDFTFASHLEWLSKKIKNQETHLFVILYKNKVAGQVRIDPNKVVSISVLTDLRGKGIAYKALKQAVEVSPRLNRTTTPAPLRAYIEPQNIASLKLFESVDFVRTGEEIINQKKFIMLARE